MYDIAYWPLTDMPAALTTVRYRGKCEHAVDLPRLLLLTPTGTHNCTCSKSNAEIG